MNLYIPEISPLVLIIDDEDANCQILEVLFKKEGIETVSAPDGEKGLQIARARLPRLILLDVFLPEEDGFEILEKIVSDKTLKDIPVILFTVLEREKSKRQAFDLGAKDYITKPFDMKEIVTRVKQLLLPEKDL